MGKTYNIVVGGGTKDFKPVSLEITRQPGKTDYKVGESFSPDGMIVTIYFENGAQMAVTGYSYTPSGALKESDTSVTVTYSGYGATVSNTVTISVTRTEIPVPTQNGAPVYDATPKTVLWNGYDANKMDKSGSETETNAGKYPVTFTPKPAYCWPGGDTSPKTVEWEIQQAVGQLSVVPQSVTLDADKTEDTVTVVTNSTGAVTAVARDPGIVDVEVEGGTVKISSVDETTGETTVTISVDKDQNHTKPDDVEVAVTASFVQIYGAEWDGSASTKLSRTDAAALFMDPVPAVGDGSGSSPFDNIMPWAGMKRVSQDGNELVSIPKYWVKVSHFPFKVQISNGPQEEFQVSPAHRNREDGQGERDVVYIGRYECDSSYMSRSGQAPKVSTALATFRSGISNLGAEYWQADYALQLTWWFLYIVEFADWNGQSVIGQGNVNTASKINTGSTDSMDYHTGRASGTNGLAAVQYRGIENPWGNVDERRDGIIFSDTYICTYNNPSNFTDTYSGTGSKSRGNRRASSNGHIKAWGYDPSDPSFIYPSEVGGSTTTFVPDAYKYSSGVRALHVSGHGGDVNDAGPFLLTGQFAPTFAGDNIGSRLMKLPNKS